MRSEKDRHPKRSRRERIALFDERERTGKENFGDGGEDVPTRGRSVGGTYKVTGEQTTPSGSSLFLFSGFTRRAQK